MSIEVKHYLGYGIRIPYDNNMASVAWDLMDEPGNTLDSGKVGDINIVIDGMRKNYIYIVKILQVTNQYNMGEDKYNKVINLDELNEETERQVLAMTAKLYDYDQYSYNDFPPIKLHSFFNCY